MERNTPGYFASDNLAFMTENELTKSKLGLLLNLDVPVLENGFTELYWDWKNDIYYSWRNLGVSASLRE